MSVKAIRGRFSHLDRISPGRGERSTATPEHGTGKLRIFGVGLAKTGTTSLAGMFRPSYRSEHEAGLWVLPKISGYLSGSVSHRSVRDAMRRRSLELDLEIDSASFLGPVARVLAEIHEDAKFVITMRDCVSWLRSLVTHLVARPLPPGSDWWAYRDARFGSRTARFHDEDKILKEHALYPLSGMLRHWSEMNGRLLEECAIGRRLVLETGQLNASRRSLAAFCRVPVGTVTAAHDNRAAQLSPVLCKIPRSFVMEQCGKYCAPLMTRLYGPGWIEEFEDRWPAQNR